jgi:hypothetical protein
MTFTYAESFRFREEQGTSDRVAAKLVWLLCDRSLRLVSV